MVEVWFSATFAGGDMSPSLVDGCPRRLDKYIETPRVLTRCRDAPSVALIFRLKQSNDQRPLLLHSPVEML